MLLLFVALGSCKWRSDDWVGKRLFDIQGLAVGLLVLDYERDCDFFVLRGPSWDQMDVKPCVCVGIKQKFQTSKFVFWTYFAGHPKLNGESE